MAIWTVDYLKVSARPVDLWQTFSQFLWVILNVFSCGTLLTVIGIALFSVTDYLRRPLILIECIFSEEWIINIDIHLEFFCLHLLSVLFTFCFNYCLFAFLFASTIYSFVLLWTLLVSGFVLKSQNTIKADSDVVM